MADSMDIDSSGVAAITESVSFVRGNHSVTLVRIKRKRTEEQVDALVIDKLKRKRARPSEGGGGLFAYAATLEEGADLQTIQEEIAALNGMQFPDAVPTRPSTPENATVNPSETTRMIAPRPSRRFNVVRSNSNTTSTPNKAGSDVLTIYDAVPEDAPQDAEEIPEDLKNFLPMLENYLRFHDADALPEHSAIGKPPEYVYDVYVHQPRQPLQNAATYTNIGSVSGLPSNFEDAWDSDSDDYAGDSEDEDSNAEDFYRNDYPDELSDDSASDEFRASDGEGSYIEDPDEYTTYDHDDDDGGPRLRIRN